MRRSIALLSVCLGVVTLASRADDLAAQSERGKQAMSAGRFQEAVAIYRELVRALPDNAGIQLNLGLALHSAGDYRAAIEQFRVVLKLQPNLFPALLLTGIAYQKLEEPAKAIDPLTRAVKLEPRSVIAQVELADASLATGALRNAAQYFERAAALDPKNTKALQGLGVSYLALSRRAFDSLERTAPDSAAWYALLARSKAEQQQFRTAFSLYRKALERDPHMPGLHTAIAGIYRKTGHPDWAEREQKLETPTVGGDSRASADYQDAIRYGDLALRTFDQLGRLPESAELHELLAESFRLQDRNREAAEELRKAIALAGPNSRLERELARALWSNRDFEAAVPLLKRLIEAGPASAELRYYLGDSLLELGDAEPALPHLEAAVAKAPDLLAAHASLARAYSRAGEPRKAVEHLKIALPSDRDGSLHFQLARAYEKLGETEQAQHMQAAFTRMTAAETARKQQLDSERQITAP